MPTTVTQATASSVETHRIDLHGRSGAIFWLTLSALVIYLVGFATTDWITYGNAHIGLWKACTCGDNPDYEGSWFDATKALITLGLIGLICTAVLVFVYMFVHSISKSTVLIIMTVLFFVSVVFMLIGFIVFGSKVSNEGFSFAFCVIAAVMTLIAGILSVLQLVQSRG